VTLRLITHGLNFQSQILCVYTHTISILQIHTQVYIGRNRHVCVHIWHIRLFSCKKVLGIFKAPCSLEYIPKLWAIVWGKINSQHQKKKRKMPHLCSRDFNSPEHRQNLLSGNLGSQIIHSTVTVTHLPHCPGKVDRDIKS
jgi:hypothetical protein